MTRPSRRTERRDDIRTEASFLGWACVVLAVVSWSSFTALVFDDGRVAFVTNGRWVVLWSALGVAGTVGAAACYVVSAVARLLAAEPEDRGPGVSGG